MEINERIKALEDEFQETRNEVKKLLLDIRAYLMDATSPLNNKSDNDQ
jgi:hypothetical protein